MTDGKTAAETRLNRWNNYHTKGVKTGRGSGCLIAIVPMEPRRREKQANGRIGVNLRRRVLKGDENPFYEQDGLLRLRRFTLPAHTTLTFLTLLASRLLQALWTPSAATGHEDQPRPPRAD